MAQVQPPWPEDEERPTLSAPQEKQQDDERLDAEKEQPTDKAKAKSEVPIEEARSKFSGNNSTYDKGKPVFMTNLYKTKLSDKDKYNGAPLENFVRKFNLFVDRCNHVMISDEDRPEAFSIMLTEPASTFYQTILGKKIIVNRTDRRNEGEVPTPGT